MLQVFTLRDSHRWDAAVRSFASHDVYWLSGYLRAFELHGDGKPLLFYYEDDTGLRGINAVMLRDIARDRRFAGKLPEGELMDLVTPYGYGGWIIQGGDPTPLFAAYEAWCRDNRIVSEFVRFHPMLSNHSGCAGVYEIQELGEVVHIDLSSPESVWEQMTSKNRNMIRKAERCGLTVQAGRDPELFGTFREIYDETMRLKQAHPSYFFQSDFYRSLREDLPDQAVIFYASLPDGTIPAASVILRENGWLNYHLSGNLRQYGSIAANNLILYRAALWGVERGCRCFYLGGGVGSASDELLRFKKAFQRGPLKRFCIGRKIFDRDAYDRLVSLRGELPPGGYFPRYRA